MDFSTAIEKYWGHATAVAVGLFTVFKAWSDQRAKRREAETAAATAKAVAQLDLAKLAQEAAGDVVQLLREEVDHWTAEVGKLRIELREAIKMIADKDAEITLLRGRNRQLEATIAAHRRHMLAAGLTLPPEPAFFELSEGELKPMGETQ